MIYDVILEMRLLWKACYSVIKYYLLHILKFVGSVWVERAHNDIYINSTNIRGDD